jgi:SAM-dependent methyltransferase
MPSRALEARQALEGVRQETGGLLGLEHAVGHVEQQEAEGQSRDGAGGASGSESGSRRVGAPADGQIVGVDHLDVVGARAAEHAPTVADGAAPRARLNVGCGPVRLEGEIGVDLFPTGGADVQGDLAALPFRDGVAERVRLDHVLEHQPQRVAVVVLAEARRVLAPGGRVVVGVPDLAGYCRAWLEADAEGDLAEKALMLRGFYGNQVHAGEYHRAGFDAQTLADLLGAAGFVDVAVGPDHGPDRTEGWCIRAHGTKAEGAP